MPTPSPPPPISPATSLAEELVAASHLATVCGEVLSGLLSSGVYRAESPRPAPRRIAGQIRLTGGFEGRLFLAGSALLASRVAEQMYYPAPASLVASDLEDAWCELANVVAGHLKGLLPGPSRLWFATAWWGEALAEHVDDEVCLSRIEFDCHGEPLAASLWRSPRRGGGEAVGQTFVNPIA